MRKILFITGCFIFLLISDVSSQGVNISLETGIGTYSMADLKSFMTASTSENPLEPVMVSYFPPYLFFSPSLSFGIKNHNIGTRYTLMSTGARSSIKDYSGEYRFDGTVVGNGFSLFDEIYVYRTPMFGLLVKLDIGGVYSKLKLQEFFQLTDVEQVNEDYRFYSINLYTLPGLKFSYNFYDSFSLFASAGYHIDILRSPLYLEESSRNMYLVGDRARKIKANWDGIRAGLGVSYRF